MLQEPQIIIVDTTKKCHNNGYKYLTKKNMVRWKLHTEENKTAHLIKIIIIIMKRRTFAQSVTCMTCMWEVPQLEHQLTWLKFLLASLVPPHKYKDKATTTSIYILFNSSVNSHLTIRCYTVRDIYGFIKLPSGRTGATPRPNMRYSGASRLGLPHLEGLW